MQVQFRNISEIRPYAQNPRHNDQAVAAVARSIREFGFRQPIVVDADGVIVVGHTRYKAALQIGLETVPVHVAHDLSPEKAKAYRLADNKLGELAEWDLELLPAELAELEALDVDLDLVGFSDEELAKLRDGDLSEGLSDPDSIPQPPDAPTTQPGDLWQLGEHRLLCGDSAERRHVECLLDHAQIHLLNADPPFNVKVEPRSNNAIAAGLSSFAANKQTARASADSKMRAKDRPLVNDYLPAEQFNRLLHAWFGNAAQALLPGRAFYVWGGYSNIANFPPVLAASGLYFSQTIIWQKGHPVLTRKDYMGDHEWCFYGWREGAAHKFFGPPNVPDVWSVKKISPQQMVHLTEKPVELAIRALQHSSRPGENVLDLFAGSGSTLIAAQQTGRRAYLMELDPLYADVIVTRWEQFTGQRAKRRTTALTSNPCQRRSKQKEDQSS